MSEEEDEILFRCGRGREPDTCSGECMAVDEDDVAWFCASLLRPYQVEEKGEIVEKWEKAHLMPPTPPTP